MKKNKLIFLLRIAVGGIFFYAGITKVINPAWSPARYLENAQTFSFFYDWLASSANLSWVTFLNEWGLTLVGVALILGIAIRLSAGLGIVLMLLYYFPILSFPYVGDHSFIVDEHIVYALVLTLLIIDSNSRKFGLDSLLRKTLPGALRGLYIKIS